MVTVLTYGLQCDPIQLLHLGISSHGTGRGFLTQMLELTQWVRTTEAFAHSQSCRLFPVLQIHAQLDRLELDNSLYLKMLRGTCRSYGVLDYFILCVCPCMCVPNLHEDMS